MNTAAVHMILKVSPWYADLTSIGCTLRSGTARSYGVSTSIVLRNEHRIFLEAEEISIPLAVNGCSSFSITSPTFILDCSYSEWAETEFQSSFNLHFSIAKD